MMILQGVTRGGAEKKAIFVHFSAGSVAFCCLQRIKGSRGCKVVTLDRGQDIWPGIGSRLLPQFDEFFFWTFLA